jgi:excisionase family DNA binding protein
MTKKQRPSDEWLSPRQAADKIGVNVETIYDACADGRLRSVKLGHSTIRIKAEWLEAWMLAQAR